MYGAWLLETRAGPIETIDMGPLNSYVAATCELCFKQCTVFLILAGVVQWNHVSHISLLSCTSYFHANRSAMIPYNSMVVMAASRTMLCSSI